ncbi:MAG TPA: cytochrome c oxidase subunit 4 [Candidatus Baltobacteraceae bacterium]|nr:cytochrome c oxidase subunit 4 [Candidatus Baltobacteraceae bacterium]
MKTFVALFLSTAAFAAAACIIYWFSSHEYAGTLFLGFMCCALGFAAAYAIFFERNARLAGDDPQVDQKERSGEDVGIVTKATPWPVVLAFSVAWLFIGLIWSDFMIFTGIAAILLCCWRLAAESARVGHERVWTEDGPEDAT